MQLRSTVENEFRFGDRAELWGAILGDGCVEKRGHKGFRVSVVVSETWPEWLLRVDTLMHAVFGERVSERKKHSITNENVYHEYYVTTHDMRAIFGVDHKYDSNKNMVIPRWIETDTEYLRLMIRGLAETDGNFYLDDTRCSFTFSQKNKFLSTWLTHTLAKLGYPAFQDTAEAAGVDVVCITRAEDVARFGEWLQSEKWAAIRDEFEGKPKVVDRKRSLAVVAREAVVHKTISLSEQAMWREWRRNGASIIAIARHVCRANSVVHAAVCDIIPERTRTAEELGLKPAPRYPRNPSRDVVEQWRAAALRGMTDVEIAKQWSVPPGKVSDAVADIRWDQRAEERARVQVEREKILSVLQKSS